MNLTIMKLKSQIVGIFLLFLILSGFANTAEPTTNTLQKEERLQIQLPKIRVDQANRSFVTGPGKIFVPFGVTYYRPVLDWDACLTSESSAKKFQQKYYKAFLADLAEPGNPDQK